MKKTKRKSKDSTRVTQIDMIKLGLCFTALDLENLKKVKELLDRVYERKVAKYECDNIENSNETI